MKLVKLITLSLAAIALLTGCGSSQSGTEAYLKEQKTIMDKMMKEMDAVKDNGSAELDFLKGMIPHHQSAVEMSESYLKHADQKGAFTDLADNIIRAQNHEIDQMNDMIDRIEKDENMDAEQEKAYMKDYDAMMANHHGSHDASETEDLDAAFAEGMSMHHQMAVDMAEIILNYTEDKELKDFADQIISQQKQEIQEMHAYLEKDASGNNHSH